MGRLKNERIIELLRDAHEALMDCASMAPGAYFEPGGEGWTVDQRIQEVIRELLKGREDD
mgnify:CR=1 FL=1